MGGLVLTVTMVIILVFVADPAMGTTAREAGQGWHKGSRLRARLIQGMARYGLANTTRVSSAKLRPSQAGGR
jgi:hypothetical protein